MPVLDGSVARIGTVGRKTGRLHEVEVWFVSKDNVVYLLAHANSDWWKNIKANPKIGVQVASKKHMGQARIVEGKYEEVIELFRGKYGRSQIDYWYGGSSVERKVVEIHIQGN